MLGLLSSCSTCSCSFRPRGFRKFGARLTSPRQSTSRSQRAEVRHAPRASLKPDETAESVSSDSTSLVPQAQTQGQMEAQDRTALQSFLYPDANELSHSEMPIWDHLDELRERILIAALAAGASIATCFCFSKDLVVFLEAPVARQGVRFLQLSPGEFFFTTFKVAGYAGLLLSTPTVLYEVAAWVFPGLTQEERKKLGPIISGSSILFFLGLLFAYEILTPAALNFFVQYADGAVESLWSIDQYFEFVLVLLLSTGLSFQVPVIQVLLGQTGIVTSQQMFAQWRYVVVGATVAAAVLTPSTDPFTQTLLAIPLIGLYLGGAACVRALEAQKKTQQA